MLRTYDRSWLRPDLLAGVTVWAMLVPQGLGYATLRACRPLPGSMQSPQYNYFGGELTVTT